MARVYGIHAAFGTLVPRDGFAKAKAAAARAVEIDDSLAEGHTVLGIARLMGDWDLAAAERELKRAIELNPRYAVAHCYDGVRLVFLKRVEEAMAEADRALERRRKGSSAFADRVEGRWSWPGFGSRGRPLAFRDTILHEIDPRK
jgi:tetratricopeptide (TPR) repeat protein